MRMMNLVAASSIATDGNGRLLVEMALFYLGPPLVLCLIGWAIGSLNERRHYASIREREARTIGLPVVTVKQLPAGWEGASARLVTGHVVVAIDYFKRFLAAWRYLIGGRVKSYETLVDRARREAVLRMKESCPEAELIVNLRIETANISQTNKDRGTGAVEVLAYGTAVRRSAMPPPL
jgi:uncharacterized protein YbjQ (UPF0145 family)